MQDPDSGRPLKKFKHQSHESTLKTVHLPTASAQSKIDEDISDTDSHFHIALDQWRQLNLSPGFVRFASQVQGLSSSMPLLLHHFSEVVSLWIEATKQSDDDALKALFDLLQKLVHDLRDTLIPSYQSILETLLSFLPTRLSAETLTVLLTTLSLFFKHLRTTDRQHLAETWSLVTDVLPRCNPEVQRAVSEVWATVLRRCKGETRVAAVELVMHNLETIADPSAWMLVHAFKSVSHTLHTCSSALFETLLSSYVSTLDRTFAERLMRRVITALIHHCETAEQFLPVSDVLVTRLTTVDSPEKTPYLVDLLSVACSVRRGSRMTQKQLSTILSHIARQPLLQEFRRNTLTLGVAALIAGEMPVWMGAGRKFVEMSWEEPSFGLDLSGILSELKWGGWRLIELPFTLRHTARLVEEVPLLTLRSLAEFASSGRLAEADETWIRRITASVQARLEAWDVNGKKEELEYIFSLGPLLPSITGGLVRVANMVLDVADKDLANEVDEATSASSEMIFGSCLQALSKSSNEEWTGQIDVRSWIIRAITRWCSSESALGGLVAISCHRGIAASSLTIAELYPLVKGSILSHSRRLRRGALELLTSTVVERTQSYEVIMQCLHGEEIPLDVQGVRERVFRIGKLPLAPKDGDDIGVDVCARWLIAQLKVNLRPLWASSVKAVGVLAQRFGESVWQLVFTELERVFREDSSQVSDPLQVVSSTEETQRAWRDPSALKLFSAVDKWSRGPSERNGANEVSEARSDKLDVANYEVQLLHTLAEIATYTRKHNAELVRLFLSFASPDLPLKPTRKKLRNWLNLFSKLDNPKAFHQSSVLLSLYRSLLSHSDRDLQSVALTCVLNYKSPHLLPYEDKFRAFLDNTRWKDELTTFDISGIEEVDRGEAVDTVVRLFFGLMLERHGRVKGVDRRASLLDAFGGCRDDELKLLIDLMLEPFGLSADSGDLDQNLLAEVSERQQIGFLNLLGDVFQRMGPRLVPFWQSLLVATIKIIVRGYTSVEDAVLSSENPDEEVDDDELSNHEAPQLLPKSRSMRTVRQLGIRRFTGFFRCEMVFDFRPYIPAAFSGFISPRLHTFEKENTQSASAILQLFHAWSTGRDYVYFLVDYDDRALPKTYACLQSPNVKPAVVSLVFEIIENILALSADDDQVTERVLKPYISSILDGLAVRLPDTSDSRNDLLHRQVDILSRVAAFVSDASQARRILQHFMPLLKRPSKVIPEKTKVHLLKIIQGIIPVVPEFQDPASIVYSQTYETFGKLFQTLRGRPARIALIGAFSQLSVINADLERISNLLASLNSFSIKRVDEPDFDRRMQAFAELNEIVYPQLSPREWKPVLFNMLLFIQDPEELSIRTNAAFSLKKFIDVLSSRKDQESETLFLRILYPGLKHGLLSKHELVRSEVLGVLAYSILKCDFISYLNEINPLLANGDAEANFFNNIYHIQTHRRTRAMRRLIELVNNGNVRSTTLSEIFSPLIGHFITDAPSTDHILVDVTIAAIGSIAGRLNWGGYNSLVRRYMNLIKEKTSAERACVRALVAVLENFHFPMDDIVGENENLAPSTDEKAEEELVQDEEDNHAEVPGPATDVSTKRIADAVNTRLLPSLLQHLERRDESDDVLRIPVSVGIVQIARHLQKDAREAQISRLLTILCQVFRSKSQDTRNLTRDTLCKIAVILGPPYIHNIVKELRAALLQGPHLHILATVVHALLVHVTSPDVVPPFNPLDGCAVDIAYVSAEVIFGQSGRNVQAEGFKTTMNEVRGSSSKGTDAFAILAKYVTSSGVSAVLSPIRGIMHETEAPKTLRLVDDLLRRISGSLNANANLTAQELLLLCHTFIQQNSRFLKEAPRPVRRRTRDKGQFTVQTKRHLDQSDSHYAHNSFRFVAFGLELFNTAFRRGRLDLKDPEIISRLEPMVPVIGNTLYCQDVPVVIQGLKATTAIVKCPLESVERSLPVFVRQTLDIVRQAGNTESEMVQSAFRTLAVILRDCSAAQIQEKDLVYLLEVLVPDLEEPTRQASVFSLLRAIVSRKFVAVEIYDVMDKVAEIMVTNQSTQVQELCRAVLLQFFLDYPQGKGRIRNQMTFLAQNLSYVYESGRLSVMELLNAVFSKFEPSLLREYADLFFVALVMVLANDDSSKCREFAAQLIKSLLTYLDTTHRQAIISHLHAWMSQKTRLQLSRVSAQVYGFVVDTLQQEIAPHLPRLMEDMNEILRRSAANLEELESTEAGDSKMDVDVEWRLPYHALNVINKVLRVHPELAKEAGKMDWIPISSHLLFPHAWVRTASSRLLGLLYNANPLDTLDLERSGDDLLSLAGLIAVARKLSLELRSETLDSSLGLQTVKNLFYIGKCFCLVPGPKTITDVDTGVETGTVDNDEEADVEHEPEYENIRGNPLPWLFSKLSYQARSAWISRRNRAIAQDNWSEQPLTIFRWFAAMSSHMEPEILEGFLVHILSPVYRIIDDDTVRDEQIGELKTVAQELVELVQNKVGTTKFAEVYNQIRQAILAVRRQRKATRAVQATTKPQLFARKKIKRNLAKRENRARKDRFFAEKKIRNGITKKRSVKG